MHHSEGLLSTTYHLHPPLPGSAEPYNAVIALAEELAAGCLGLGPVIVQKLQLACTTAGNVIGFHKDRVGTPGVIGKDGTWLLCVTLSGEAQVEVKGVEVIMARPGKCMLQDSMFTFTCTDCTVCDDGACARTGTFYFMSGAVYKERKHMVTTIHNRMAIIFRGVAECEL